MNALLTAKIFCRKMQLTPREKLTDAGKSVRADETRHAALQPCCLCYASCEHVLVLCTVSLMCELLSNRRSW